MYGKLPKSNGRTMAEIQAHYAIEKELSDRLRHSGRADRLILYRTLNEELFRRVPSHPLLTRKKDPLARARKVAEEMKLLGPLLRPDSTFLEVGPGDCALSFEVARRVKKVYAIDVSEEITRSEAFPPNLELIISDGCAVPVAGESVDVAYSNQLMEHLHPDDGREQLRNIHAALKPGGKYLCITPNRLSGPHDISVY